MHIGIASNFSTDLESTLRTSYQHLLRAQKTSRCRAMFPTIFEHVPMHLTKSFLVQVMHAPEQSSCNSLPYSLVNTKDFW